MRETRIIERLARIRIFLGTGQGHIDFLKYPIFVGIFLKQWFPSFTMFQLVGLVILSILVLIFNGWFDLKFIKLPQTQAEISTRDYNPYFERLEKNLNSSVNKEKHKEFN